MLVIQFVFFKLSVLLHTVNTVEITITLRDYGRGKGPSQAEREKRKSTRRVFIPEKHVFGVELDAELPTIGNIVEDDDSGCEPKCKRVPQKSKLFTS